MLEKINPWSQSIIFGRCSVVILPFIRISDRFKAPTFTPQPLEMAPVLGNQAHQKNAEKKNCAGKIDAVGGAGLWSFQANPLREMDSWQAWGLSGSENPLNWMNLGLESYMEPVKASAMKVISELKWFDLLCNNLLGKRCGWKVCGWVLLGID